ncbi:MAG TPA: glycosyltransferase [Pedobacter sp.]|nr:glycosyltransferase [Pedobacter sp.]
MKNKIAFISEHASPLAAPGGIDSGGQNVYVAELALELSRAGYEIDIFTRRDSEHLLRTEHLFPGVRVINIDAGPAEQIPKEELLVYMDEFSTDVQRFIEQETVTYDLIHANFFMSGLVAMQLKRQYKIPFVITFHALGRVRKMHQGDNDRFPAERLNIEAALVNSADALIAECPQDLEDLVNYYQADPSKISVIPCGFNPAEFYPMDKALSREVLGLDPGQKLILQLGRMVPRKGVDNVIRALSILKKDPSNPKLLIVGGEKESADLDKCPEMLRLKRLAIELELEDRVIFAGKKDRGQLNIYYDAADVFVTTPWYEPFGITPLEAMACATPVVGSGVGGIKYSVADGKTGFLVPPKSPQLLADRISLLLNNDSLLQQMGETALEHVHEHFTWKGVAVQMAVLYDQVLNPDTVKTLDIIEDAFEDAARTFRKSAAVLAPAIAEAAGYMCEAFKRGNKILVCGNGGSAAESQHFAAELVGRFEIPNRPGLPAISLTADTSILTAWSNDFGYDDVFGRQIQAYGQTGDVLLCLSTSGASRNIINAINCAKAMGIQCITMLGRDGGEAAKNADVNLIVPSQSSQRIQEVHLHLVHVLCGLIENSLFGEVTDEKEAVLQHKSLKLIRDDVASHRYGS